MKKYLSYFWLFLTVCVIAMNIYSVVGPLFGVSTADLSDQRSTLITPAGYAFSIWSLIYMGISAVAIYKVFRTPHLLKNNELYAYGVSCVANILWLVSRHSQSPTLALLCMLVLLASLVYLCNTLRIHKEQRRIQSVFLVYLGWISVATLINLLVVSIYVLGIFSSEHLIVPVVCLIAVAMLYSAVIYRHKLFEPALVVVWAYVAIVVASQNQTITIVCTALSVLLLLRVVSIYALPYINSPKK